MLEGGRGVNAIASAITVFVLILDCTLPVGVSVNSLYCIVILVSAYSPRTGACFRWAAVTTLASLIAVVAAPAGLGMPWEILDRSMTIFSIWVAALIVSRVRRSRAEAVRAQHRAVEALEAKGRFLSAASHDLRQPVQSLVLFAGALRERVRGSPTQERIVETMVTAIEALRLLLDKVLDISKLEAGAIRIAVGSVGLREILLRLGQEYAPRAAAKGLKLRVVANNLWVLSDAVLIEQILRNLIENAVNYTQAGGVLVGCHRRAGEVRVDVIDTGRGIPAAELSHIFEEFYQLDNPQRSRERGSGLGLAIVRRAADLLGHRLAVTSVEGRGSCFSVSLPAAAAPTVGAAGDSPLPNLREKDAIRVLVVEDDPLVSPALKLSLEGMGCQVAVAACHRDAMTAARAHPPALIISDFRLPGANGIQTIDDIRKMLGAPVPASLLTGDLAPALEAQSRDKGMGLLRKPVSRDDLAVLVESARGPIAAG